jgi:hypothetical protein
VTRRSPRASRDGTGPDGEPGIIEDKGCHSDTRMNNLAAEGVPLLIPEPDRGSRDSLNAPAAKRYIQRNRCGLRAVSAKRCLRS